MVAAVTAHFLSKTSVQSYFQSCKGPECKGPGKATTNPTSKGTISSINKGFFIAGGIAAVLGLGMSLLLAFEVAKPVSELTEAARGITMGDYSQRVRSGRGGAEIGELAEAFNSLAEGLEKNERLRRKMAADISHELRNPLASMQAQLEAMQDGVVEADGEALSSLAEDISVLSRLVNDLHQLSLAEAGRLELSRLPVDTAELLRSVAARFAAAAAAAEVIMEHQVEEALPPVDVDPVRISQVLGNLVDNALRHTPAGGGINLAASRAGDMVAVSVVDTGCGIGPDDLPFIFERFYRAEPARERATGGAGIGLSVAKSLVEAHGGTFSVSSEPGKGTSISFTLPAYSNKDS